MTTTIATMGMVIGIGMFFLLSASDYLGDVDVRTLMFILVLILCC